MSNLKKQNSSASVSPHSAHQALCILATLAGILGVNLSQTDARASLADQPPPQRFTFTKIATLGVSPNFGDFEFGQINNRGDLVFVSETAECVDTGLGFSACEGVFLLNQGRVSQIVTAGNPAPRGGSFAGAVSGPSALNQGGDAAVALALTPFTFPFGLNAGLYRYTSGSGTLSAVVVPGVTPVPGSSGIAFQGTDQGVSINNLGTIAFPGAFPISAGLPGTSSGVGIFTADRSGSISRVIVPGDAAPGGASFDDAQNTGINDLGDVVFEAHLAGAECVGGQPDPAFTLGCNATGVYLRQALSGNLIKIAQQGDLDPLGAPFRHAWGPVINNSGQVVFVGDLTPPPANEQSMGLYLYNGSSIVPVVRPGDALPGGGTLKTVNDFVHSYGLNNRGDVSFSAVLSSGDQGVYVKSGSTIRLVAKTGTVMPGIGTFSAGGGGPSGPVINDRGQVSFSATLASGDTVLLVATLSP